MLGRSLLDRSSGQQRQPQPCRTGRHVRPGVRKRVQPDQSAGTRRRHRGPVHGGRRLQGDRHRSQHPYSVGSGRGHRGNQEPRLLRQPNPAVPRRMGLGADLPGPQCLPDRVRAEAGRLDDRPGSEHDPGDSRRPSRRDLPQLPGRSQHGRDLRAVEQVALERLATDPCHRPGDQPAPADSAAAQGTGQGLRTGLRDAGSLDDLTGRPGEHPRLPGL